MALEGPEIPASSSGVQFPRFPGQISLDKGWNKTQNKPLAGYGEGERAELGSLKQGANGK